MPKVSVIIPCYNQGHFLYETVSSVRNQTLKEWECIIVDDGSTDNTAKIAKRLCADDSRIRLVSKENGGLSSARNAGIAVSKGKYLQFLDSDDYIMPDKLEKQVLLMEECPDCAISVSRYRLFMDSVNKLYDSSFSLHDYDFSLDSLLYEWGKTFTFPPVCYLVRNDFIKKFNILYNENLRAYEDWYFLIQLKLCKAQFLCIDEPLSLYRQHRSQMTQDAQHMLSTLTQAIIAISHILPKEERTAFPRKMGEYVYLRYYNTVKFDIRKGQSLDYKIGRIILTPARFIKKIMRRHD